MATIKVTDKKAYIFGCSIHSQKNLQNGISCSKLAYFLLILYYTDSLFLDIFGLNLIQGLILAANSKSEAILCIRGG